MTAKKSHERKKEAENQNIVQIHESSIRLVRKSFTYLHSFRKYCSLLNMINLLLSGSVKEIWTLRFITSSKKTTINPFIFWEIKVQNMRVQTNLERSILSDLTMVLILPCLETILFLLDWAWNTFSIPDCFLKGFQDEVLRAVRGRLKKLVTAWKDFRL